MRIGEATALRDAIRLDAESARARRWAAMPCTHGSARIGAATALRDISHLATESYPAPRWATTPFAQGSARIGADERVGVAQSPRGADGAASSAIALAGGCRAWP
jgi:hypothetical protein